jgi:hypothetical protein
MDFLMICYYRENITDKIKLTDKTYDKISDYNSFLFSFLLNQTSQQIFEFLFMIAGTKISRTSSNPKDKSSIFQKTTSED